MKNISTAVKGRGYLKIFWQKITERTFLCERLALRYENVLNICKYKQENEMTRKPFIPFETKFDVGM